jgi:hypothetical protein
MKKYRMILSRNTLAADIPLYYVVMLAHDMQCLSTNYQPYESVIEAFNNIKDSIMYTNQKHPEIKTFFSVCDNYRKTVPQKFVNLDIHDDDAMMQMLLSME